MSFADSLHLFFLILIPTIFLCVLICLCKRIICKMRKDNRTDSTAVLHPPPINLYPASIGAQGINARTAQDVAYNPNRSNWTESTNRTAQNVADVSNRSNSAENTDRTSQYVRLSVSAIMENESLRTLSDNRTGSLLLSHSLSGYRNSNYLQGMYEVTSFSSPIMQYPDVRSSDMDSDKPPDYSDVIQQDLMIGEKQFPEVSTKPPDTPPPNYNEKIFKRF